MPLILWSLWLSTDLPKGKLFPVSNDGLDPSQTLLFLQPPGGFICIHFIQQDKTDNAQTGGNIC